MTAACWNRSRRWIDSVAAIRLMMAGAVLAMLSGNVVAQRSTAARGYSSPMSPGVQNLPQGSVGKSHRSFATPGANNLGTSNWENSTVWNQPVRPQPERGPFGGGRFDSAPIGSRFNESGRVASIPQRSFEASPRFNPAPVPQFSTIGPRSTGFASERAAARPTFQERQPTQFIPRGAPQAGSTSQLLAAHNLIRIRMPADQSFSCNYVLADTESLFNYTMLPGKSQTFPADRNWVIRFDRGEGLGLKSYRLEPGEYEFRQSSRGWELYNQRLMTSSSLAFAP